MNPHDDPLFFGPGSSRRQSFFFSVGMEQRQLLFFARRAAPGTDVQFLFFAPLSDTVFGGCPPAINLFFSLPTITTVDAKPLLLSARFSPAPTSTANILFFSLS